MLRIHLLHESTSEGEPIGCSYIRLLLPFQHQSVSEHVTLSFSTVLPLDGQFDVVVVERLWRPDVTLPQIQDLVDEIRKRSARLVYFIDDNLLDLHIDEPWNQFPSDEQRMVIRYLCRNSDGVVVGTERLKERLLKFNRNIEVVHNALDESLFSIPSSNNIQHSSEQIGEVTRFGYMGTHTHQSDLMHILSSLREFMRESQGKVVLELVGVSADRRVIDCFKGLPIYAHTVDSNHSYNRFIPWAVKNLHWSFAIAPLVNNNFNSYKSDIKYLDYCALGIPAVYSDVAVYRSSVIHGETGLLCQNNHESWLTALRSMRDDVDLRHSISSLASKYIVNNRILKHRAKDWISALEKLLAINICSSKLG